MAEKIKIDLDIDAGSSLKTMGDLEASVESMMEELKKTDVASDRFNELQSSIAGATSKIKDMELGMEGLDMEQKSSEIGSFAAGLADTATGAMALSGALGITNESSEKMIENLVSGMAVAQTFRGGLDGIISAQKLLRNVTVKSAVAQRVLNAVMKANPIVLLISLIVSAVAAIAAYTDIVNSADTSQEVFNESMKSAVDIAGKELYALEELKGAINDDTKSREDRVKAVKKLQKEHPKLLENLDAEKTTTEDLNDAIDKNSKLVLINAEVKALEKMAEEEYIKQLENKVDMKTGENKGILDNIMAIATNTLVIGANTNAQYIANERSKEAIKTGEDRRKIIEEQKEALLLKLDALKDNTKATEENGEEQKEANKKTAATTKEVKKLAIGLQEIDDLLNKPSDSEVKGPEGDEIKQEIEKIDKEHTLKLTKIANFERDKTFTKEEADAQRLIAERERLDKLRTVQLNYNMDTEETDLKIARNKLSLSKMTDAEILANKKKTNDDIVEDEKKTAEEKRAIASETIGFISQGMDAVASLMKTSNKAEIEAAEGNEAKQKKLRKEGFEQQKKFQIASAVMGMAQGIISGLGAPFPMNISMPIIAGVTGAAQIAKIASTTFTGGGGGGSTPTPSVSTTAPNIQETPGVNLFGQGNEGSEGDSSQFGSQGQGNQIKAVVSWSDIDAVQKNDINIQQEMQL